MKKDLKICALLIMMLMLVLTMYTNVNAAEGDYSTIGMKIKPVKDTSQGDGTGSYAVNSWWIYSDFKTGTRYVLRIDGEEVPEEYYINHMDADKKFYSGTNVMKSGKFDTSMWSNEELVIDFYDDNDGVDEYNHVTNWKDGNNKDFGLSRSDTKKIMDAIRLLAVKNNDTYWINKIDNAFDINNNQDVIIEVRAEILVAARTAINGRSSGGKAFYMTYNEIRKTALYHSKPGDGTAGQINTIRTDRGLDALACKLYEDNPEYTIDKYGNVKCSCNYLVGGDTHENLLTPLTANPVWTIAKRTSSVKPMWVVDQVFKPYQSPFNTTSNSVPGGFMYFLDDTRFQGYYGHGHRVNVQYIMPNICSRKHSDGKYYVTGASEYNGEKMGTGIYVLPAGIRERTYNDAAQWYDHVEGQYSYHVINVQSPIYKNYTYGKNGFVIPGFNTDTAYIFEGWDYIVSGPSTDVLPNDLTVTEKYYEEGTTNSIAEDLVTPYEKENGKTYSHKVTIKDIEGYIYSYSEPTGEVIDVSDDKEIIHYYKPYVAPVKLTVNYIDDETGEIIHTKMETEIRKGIDFPAAVSDNETLESLYKIETENEIVGSFGQEYSGYELDKENVKVDGKKYDLDDMPASIKMDENKIIEFHYKRIPEATVIPRIISVEYVNGIYSDISDIIPFPGYTRDGFTVQKNRQLTFENNSGYAGEYLGHFVEYKDNKFDSPTYTQDKIEDADEDEDAKYKIPNDKNYAFLDFIYKIDVNTYEVTVNYIDEDTGLQIGDETHSFTVEEGKYHDMPDGHVPSQYVYQYRDDGETDEYDDIGPVNHDMIVNVYYKISTYNVIVQYIDEETGDLIGIGETTIENIPYGDKVPIPDGNIPSGYTFNWRNDGKPNEDDDIGPVYNDMTVKVYYLKNPLVYNPVVSYPTLTTPHTGNKVIVGENITVRIPNTGYHQQAEDDLLLTPPENGWNYEYAQEIYLKADCDVFYNGSKKGANTPFKVANETDIKNVGNGSISVDLLIPEWVTKGSHNIEVIVGATTGGTYLGDSSLIGDNWNKLDSEVAASEKVTINVTGKVYDFQVTNLMNDEKWPATTFKNENDVYTAGLNVAGNTLPIGQKPTQPAKYTYGMALGSTFMYNLNTLGIDNKQVLIEPKLVYVTKDGNIKDDVVFKSNVIEGSSNKVQYMEIASGHPGQLKNKLGDGYQSVRTNLINEIAKASQIGFTSVKADIENSIGTYYSIRLKETQKVPFVKYFEEVARPYYDALAKDKALKSACHWYGTYSLPASTIVVDSDGNELKNGFIVVMFKIKTIDGTGAGYLTYENQLVGNQWKNENSNNDIVTVQFPKTSVSDMGAVTTFNISSTNPVQNGCYGYYPVAVYQVGVRTNYEAGGTH